MPNFDFTIDARLKADSHELFAWRGCHLRLNKNASIPWLLVVPETTQVEFCDLTTQQQLDITYLGQVIGDYLKKQLGAEKINFAAIGNVVQQLHVHVVGRHPQDALWPDVVWGAKIPVNLYSQQQITTIKTDLQHLLEQQQS